MEEVSRGDCLGESVEGRRGETDPFQVAAHKHRQTTRTLTSSPLLCAVGNYPRMQRLGVTTVVSEQCSTHSSSILRLCFFSEIY